MLKVSLATALAAAALAIPAAYAFVAKPTQSTVEHALLERMNGGADGRITRSVHCALHRGGGASFECRLTSVGSTTIGARVTLDDGDVVTLWEPLQG